MATPTQEEVARLKEQLEKAQASIQSLEANKQSLEQKLKKAHDIYLDMFYQAEAARDKAAELKKVNRGLEAALRLQVAEQEEKNKRFVVIIRENRGKKRKLKEAEKTNAQKVRKTCQCLCEH